MQYPNEEMIIREIRIPKWVDDYYTDMAHRWRKSPEKMMTDTLTDRAQFSVEGNPYPRPQFGT